MSIPPVELPPSAADQVRYPAAQVEQIRALATTLTDAQIADSLNQEGQTSPKGKTFTTSIIQWVRYRYRISAPQLKHPDELTVEQMMQEFGVSRHVVYYWIERGVVKARRLNRGSPYWITVDQKKEQALREWVRNSSRILTMSNS